MKHQHHMHNTQLTVCNISMLFVCMINGAAYAADNDDHPHVTKEVYCQCISEIKNWIDIGAMQTQLMTQGVIITPDDLYNITHGMCYHMYVSTCG